MKKEPSSQAESILESVWEQTPNQCAVLVSKFLAGSFIEKLRYSQASNLDTHESFMYRSFSGGE